MKIKCEYCGNYIDDSQEKCEYCGAANSGIRRTGNQVPRTIDELKQWYIDHNLPDENITRFFIGRDYAGPKAFGIYKQADGDFVVYKNKSDGSRMTRYVGKDETYAVQEIYLKLKEEMQNQKNFNQSNTNFRSFYTPNTRSAYYMPNNPYNNSSDSGKWAIIIIVLFMILVCVFSSCTPRTGNHYYRPSSSYSSSYYDNDNDYDSSSSWSSSYDNDYDSSWSSSSWDSDWDSSSSWDSGWSDWDSDW